jgi:Helix-turn-helix domain
MQEEGCIVENKQIGGSPGPALISVSEFAGRMGISLSTARRLCYTRTVATVKFNRSLLVPVAEVDRLIQAHLQPALPAAGQTR